MSVSNADWRPTATFATLELRARLLQQLRAYFSSRGILEVETPLLSSTATTEVHLQSFVVTDPDRPQPSYYLHTSPELAMKRLLAAGSGSIYQICKVFRAGERGVRHLPEFTMLEWYRVNTDYDAFIAENVRLIETLLAEQLKLQPVVQLSYRRAFVEYAGVDPFIAETSELHRAFVARVPADVSTLDEHDRQTWLDLLLTHVVEPHLPRERLVVIRDYPADQASLAALSKTNPVVAERFEIYCNGLELANGFHELTDLKEQQKRIENELHYRQQHQLPSVPVDEKFLAAIAHGLPDCCGIAIGFDRVVMLATQAKNIADVVALTN